MLRINVDLIAQNVNPLTLTGIITSWVMSTQKLIDVYSSTNLSMCLDMGSYQIPFNSYIELEVRLRFLKSLAPNVTVLLPHTTIGIFNITHLTGAERFDFWLDVLKPIWGYLFWLPLDDLIRLKAQIGRDMRNQLFLSHIKYIDRGDSFGHYWMYMPEKPPIPKSMSDYGSMFIGFVIFGVVVYYIIRYWT